MLKKNKGGKVEEKSRCFCETDFKCSKCGEEISLDSYYDVTMIFCNGKCGVLGHEE